MSKSYQNKKLLYQFYVDEQKSIRELAKILKCGYNTIRRMLKKYNIPIRTPSESQTSKLNSQYRPFLERFWEKIDRCGPSRCWNWMASCRNGYGAIGKHNKTFYAHVIAFELYYGRKVKEGHIIHHICGNRKCCNPQHLQELTIFEHTSLHHRGEKCHTARLVEKQVVEIRTKYRTGTYSQRQLSQEYGVSRSTIGYIVNQKNWKYIRS